MATELITAVGRRKTAVATVLLSKADANELTINGKSPKEYLKTDERVRTALEAFPTAEAASQYRVSAHVEGGGISAQAGAVRLAIARALIDVEPNTRGTLKSAGMLTRDARAKERKKPGLKKARKAPQWSKR